MSNLRLKHFADIICDESTNDEELEKLTIDELFEIYYMIEPRQSKARSRIGKLLLAQGLPKYEIPYIKMDLPLSNKSSFDLLAHLRTEENPVILKQIMGILQNRNVFDETMDDISNFLLSQESLGLETNINFQMEGSKVGKTASLKKLEKNYISLHSTELEEILKLPGSHMALHREAVANILKNREIIKSKLRNSPHTEPPEVVGEKLSEKLIELKDDLSNQSFSSADNEEEGVLEEYEEMDTPTLIRKCKKNGAYSRPARILATIELLRRGFQESAVTKMLPPDDLKICEIASWTTESQRWHIVSSKAAICNKDMISSLSDAHLIELSGITAPGFKGKRKFARLQLLKRRPSEWVPPKNLHSQIEAIKEMNALTDDELIDLSKRPGILNQKLRKRARHELWLRGISVTPQNEDDQNEEKECQKLTDKREGVNLKLTQPPNEPIAGTSRSVQKSHDDESVEFRSHPFTSTSSQSFTGSNKFDYQRRQVQDKERYHSGSSDKQPFEEKSRYQTSTSEHFQSDESTRVTDYLRPENGCSSVSKPVDDVVTNRSFRRGDVDLSQNYRNEAVRLTTTSYSKQDVVRDESARVRDYLRPERGCSSSSSVRRPVDDVVTNRSFRRGDVDLSQNYRNEAVRLRTTSYSKQDIVRDKSCDEFYPEADESLGMQFRGKNWRMDERKSTTSSSQVNSTIPCGKFEDELTFSRRPCTSQQSERYSTNSRMTNKEPEYTRNDPHFSSRIQKRELIHSDQDQPGAKKAMFEIASTSRRPPSVQKEVSLRVRVTKKTNDPFSDEDFSEFETLLINFLLFSNDTPPTIDKTIRNVKYLVMCCADEYSQQWLLKNIPSLLLDNKPLCAVKEEN